ncbi:MAG TPA: polyprenyl synthetase family protein [Candidatus Deferrimicrobium sp.]|nr:polyprenyl synthetase family protein [Candidatus Deferrimicrobium sp.]
MCNYDQLVETELHSLVDIPGLSSELKSLMLACLEYPHNSRPKEYRWAKLIFASCEAFSGKPELALSGAVAMELFARAADILDDLQDEDNDNAIWRRIPSSQATILATNLLLLSYEALSPVAGTNMYPRVIRIINRTGLTAGDGQFQETLYDLREDATLDEYLELIGKKSGSLTAGACTIGGIFGGASPETASQLWDFGVKLGQIAQIDNDLQDFLNITDKSDLMKGKKTLPFVYLLNMLEGEKAQGFKKLVLLARENKEQFGALEKEQLLDIMLNEGAAHYCMVVQEMFRQDALNILNTIPTSDEQKGKLKELVCENV